MSDVTRILNAIERGDAKATDELLPLVYEELRLLAAQRLSHESPGQTLQATALVHEVYIRLLGVSPRAGRTGVISSRPRPTTHVARRVSDMVATAFKSLCTCQAAVGPLRGG